MNWESLIHEAYEDEGVWVTIPPQDSGHFMWFEKVSDPLDTIPTEMLGTPGVFQPSDIRIGFQVWEQLADGSSQIMQKFSPPMVLRVKITPRALEEKKIPGPLRLAFWDGSEWELFTELKHLFRLTPKSGIAVIRDWGDPMVAWG